MKRRKLDKCAYMIYNLENVLVVGLVILHVDDILMGINLNDSYAVETLAKIKNAFDFSKWQQPSPKESIVYCGGRTGMQNDDIMLGFENYMKKVMPITIQKNRGKDERLTRGEMSKARAHGALQWPAGQGCPQLSASTLLTAANINKATVEMLSDLWRSFKLVRICKLSLSAENQACAIALRS